MAHLIWPLMAHHWCAIDSMPLVIFTNGASPGAPLVSGILYTQVLWHTNGALPQDAPLVTAAY